MNSLYGRKEILTINSYFVTVVNWAKNGHVSWYDEISSGIHRSFCEFEISPVNTGRKLVMAVI